MASHEDHGVLPAPRLSPAPHLLLVCAPFYRKIADDMIAGATAALVGGEAGGVDGLEPTEAAAGVDDGAPQQAAVDDGGDRWDRDRELWRHQLSRLFGSGARGFGGGLRQMAG